MRNYYLLLIIPLFIQCSYLADKKQNRIDQIKKKITVCDIQFDSITYYPKLAELDEKRINNWMPHIFNNYIFKSRLFSAYLYSVQPKINNNSVYIVYTSADDWSWCHLVTTDSNDNLIDLIDVSNLFEGASDDSIRSVNYTFIEETEMCSDSVYETTKSDTTEYYYNENEDTLYITSKKIRFLIQSNGKILKIDSTELIKKTCPNTR